MNKELEDIIVSGTSLGDKIRLWSKDGREVSVIAGWHAYCAPRPIWDEDIVQDFPGPYTHVEVGMWSRPQPWDQWEQYCEDDEQPPDGQLRVFGYVPVDLVRELVTGDDE